MNDETEKSTAEQFAEAIQNAFDNRLTNNIFNQDTQAKDSDDEN